MQYRRYMISSSFKMAVLFSILLGVSMTSSIYIYWQVSRLLVDHSSLRWAAIVAMTSMLLVILISFFISIFVVKRINHIARTAMSIMNTGDLTQRIKIKTGWDDLSNLALILNHLFAEVDTLMQDVKAVSDNIAHDLRTPLTRLYNHLQSLHQQWDHQETRYALRESENLLNIFHALLRITHLEHGKQKLYRQIVCIEKLVQDAAALYEPIFEQQGVTLMLMIDPMKIMLDRDMMFQVLVNILDNVVKHSQHYTCLEIIGQRSETEYRLAIKDNGAGVSESAHQKLFDRFYQEDSKRSTGGAGLGLALVKAIINRHGGYVCSEANHPHGLTMIIVLPVTKINYI